MLSRYKLLTLALTVAASLSHFGATVVTAVQTPKPTKRNLLETEQLLSNLGYWVVKVDGVADSSTFTTQ